MKLNRREFIRTTSTAAGLSLAPGTLPGQAFGDRIFKPARRPVTIDAVDSGFEREPLIRPFGFKGGYMSEIWQTVAMMKSSAGTEKAGLCTQNVLWSDAAVFAGHSESGGNALMYAISERALQLCRGRSFETPVQLLEEILEEVYLYGKKVTANPELRKTFALNALVGVDNAAWLLWAAEKGITSFDEMIPPACRPALSHRHDTVASIPLMAYNIPISEITEAARQIGRAHV